MWLAAVEWLLLGPFLAGVAAILGILMKWSEAREQKRAAQREADKANGKLSGAFQLIDQLQEDNDRLRKTLGVVEDRYEAAREQIRQSYETENLNDQLFQENARLKLEVKGLRGELRKLERKPSVKRIAAAPRDG